MMHFASYAAAAFAVGALLALGCSSTTETPIQPSPQIDAGFEADTDDVGIEADTDDVGIEAQPPSDGPDEAAADGSHDAPTDVTLDASPDSNSDADADAGPDAGPDGPKDASGDVEPIGVSAEFLLGDSCTGSFTPAEILGQAAQPIIVTLTNTSVAYHADLWSSAGSAVINLAPGASWTNPDLFCLYPYATNSYIDVFNHDALSCPAKRLMIRCQ